jgi:hypothetical protein
MSAINALEGGAINVEAILGQGKLTPALENAHVLKQSLPHMRFDPDKLAGFEQDFQSYMGTMIARNKLRLASEIGDEMVIETDPAVRKKMQNAMYELGWPPF